MTPAPTAILMPIGNELLNGRVVDSNSAYAAGKLYHRGIVVQRIVAIPDDLALIAHEIQVHRAMADLLITSGGIGATADDLTRQAVALAFDLPLERNEEAVAMMTTPTSGYSSAARWRMADLPRGCTLIPNPVTKAPGFIVENVYVLPGVPELFRLMFDSLEPGFPGRPMFFAELYTFRHEGEYAYLMDDAVARFPGVNIGSYPKLYHSDYACLLTFSGTAETEVAAARRWFDDGLAALPPRPGMSTGIAGPGSASAS